MLQDFTKEKIRPLLVLNDELRKLTVMEKDLNVTSIVAVGDQSSGKTSVIESLSGVPLPRGEGIQTRLPLIMKLRTAENDEEEYCLLKAENMEEIRVPLEDLSKEIENLTAKLAGDAGKDVADSPLELTVFRKDQDDLTLIDLPGMTRVPIKGQHAGIEETITAMYKRYMKPEEHILLNVASGLADFSISKALEMSRKMDPNGKRTLLCVTKLDADIEPAANRIRRIEEDYSGLRLGEHVFCVRNRNQKESEAKMELAEARMKEKAFFSGCAELDDFPRQCLGTAALSSRLVTLQCHRIKESLPAIISKVSSRLSQHEQDLASLGDPPPSTEAKCRLLFHRLLSSGITAVSDQLSGHSLSTTRRPVHSCQLDLRVGVKNKKDTSPMKECGGCEWKLESTRDGTKASLFVDCQLGPNISRCWCEVTCEASVLDSIRQQLAFCNKFDKSTGRGYTTFVDDTLCKDKVIQMKVTMLLSPIKTSEEPTQLLCAELKKRGDAFVEEINQLYPNTYFFSTLFRKTLHEETSLRSGAQGLPGAIMPESAVAILQSLRDRLKPLLTNYTNDISKIAHLAFTYLIVDKFFRISHPPRSADERSG
eukprot:TRINITY_DN1536_c0_g3_i1.p1 TRINITY_DN1536_c0_g3~~TRINITY_DN1536_c0_g3_i1.p1  ORF type:complete len:595 (-),score=108.06 TRINITY_DN1536_c0_g3_i1:1528-3312(-)